ncbi:Acetyltransferase (GNAT) family protein [Lentzea waywayandensis]|uniref:Acetyltransferase (GNAT) family protein n=1 Tax=Lentzea waywayandensis TaxID=84724 RepID=A0A1I6FAS4_9PSEU|nr:GNAT family N-acetyltransferase [Lentzea waywayandensis]SFR27055.1 Acetyltransferase (GNAT) family protein [Lentzea waywayandensis]
MDSAYRLVLEPPSVDDYLRLRKESGLSARTREEAENGINGAWASASVIHVESGESVGMGRVLSDGGWYFHVIDMAVLPDHQRKGVGDAILTALLDHIDACAPNAYVNLLADPPGRRLYERHGFTESAPASVGMRRV